jgi:hypothetical protein
LNIQRDPFHTTTPWPAQTRTAPRRVRCTITAPLRCMRTAAPSSSTLCSNVARPVMPSGATTTNDERPSA